MAGFTDYFENKIIDHMLRNQAFTPPSQLYLGLFTVSPTDSGGGTEVSGNGYQRVAITLSAASNGQTSNTATIDFPQATGDWGTIVAAGIFDAVTGGNLLMWTTISPQKTITSGDIFRIPAGNLTISVD